MSILLTSGFGNFMIQNAYATIPTLSATTTTTTTTTVTVNFSIAVYSNDEATGYAQCFRVDAQTPFGDALPTTQSGGGDTSVILTVLIPLDADATPSVTYDAVNCIGGTSSIVDDTTASGDVLSDGNVTALDGLAPTFISAITASSTRIDVTFSESMADPGAPPSDFEIAGGLTNAPMVTEITVAGSVLQLTLNQAIVNGDTPTVSYANTILSPTDTATFPNNLANFGAQAVTNNVAAVVDPTTEKKKGGGGCDGDCTPPTIGLDKNGVRLVDNGFSYNNNAVDAILFHTPFPLISAHIGNTNTVSIKAWENSGPQGISLVQFGLGIPEIGSPLNDAEVIIEVWISNTEIEKIAITDPHNLIENSSVSALSGVVQCRADSDNECLGVTMNYMYREAPLYNVMSVEVMDQKRNVQSTTFNDGIEVLGESMNPADILNLVPNTTQNYPQKSGLVTLTQIDRSAQLWVDPYGYMWQGDNSKMTLISEIPFVRFNDSESEFTGYNSRLNSNFVMYKEEQLEKAQMTFDYLTYYKQIQGDDLTGYVAKTFDNVKLERSDDVPLQQAIVDEQIRAAVTFEQILDSTFVPKN